MKSRILQRAILASVFGHAVSLLFLFISALVCIKLGNPDAASFAVSVIALLLGSTVCALSAKKMSKSIPCCSLAGFIYGMIIFALSFIGKDSQYGFFTKLLICLLPTALASLTAVITPNKKSSRKSVSGRMKSMYKRI